MRIGAWDGQGMMIWGNMNRQWNNASKVSILQQAAQYAMAMHMQTAQGMLQLLKMNG